jgi:hypothetical protein
MEQKPTIEEAFDVGNWVGRRQALALVAGRCSAADAEILCEIRENKLFLTMEQTWDDFCVRRLGASRSYVNRVIQQFRALGPNFSKLNCLTPIKPAEYRRLAGAVTEDGLFYGGEVIALEPENAAKLAAAVEALRREATPVADPIDPAGESLAKAEKAVNSAVKEFQRLRTMKLDDEKRSILMIVIARCGDLFDLIHLATAE